MVHKWRSEEQAIVVGTNTVLEDNPSLTVRDWSGKNPTRIVLDKHSRVPKDAAILDDKAKTMIISNKGASGVSETENFILEYLDWNLKNSIAQQICNILFQNNINSVIIEGGRQTLQTFIDENLWDEARIFTGPTTFGSGTKSPDCSGKLLSQENILDDTLKIIVND